MKNKILLLFSLLVFCVIKTEAQPFADVVSFNYQTFSSAYKANTHFNNKTDNYTLNFFLPKVFKNGNILLIRLNTEMINSTITPDSSYSSMLSAVSLPLGFKFVSKNKRWETVIIGIPKLASDFKGPINNYDLQYGGIFLETFVVNQNIKIKGGLYYNREAFGNFYVPLAAVDLRITNRINLYGILPTNYKLEFNLIKNKLYTGVNFKSLTRSFRLSQSDKYDYVRYDEEQVKLFVDCFVYKKFLAFGEVGYTLGKNPWQYTYNTKLTTDVNPVYMPLKSYPIFNIGIAYRIRTDLDKSQ